MDAEEMDREELFFENETRKHQQEVARNMILFAQELMRRAMIHDASKLESPEREIFIRMTPKLRDMTYGSDEYKAALKELGEALHHHYAHNDHHPEHGEEMENMDLFSVVEMVCDWMAACKRHADGDIFDSLRVNKVRFGIGHQLLNIFINTAHGVQLIESLDGTNSGSQEEEE